MSRQIFNRTVAVDGVDIFYREAGDRKNPSLLLLHGFPTSSIMYKGLMTAMGDQYHLVAPDYPGFGFSAFPGRNKFEYTFRNISRYINRFTEEIGLSSFTLFLHDYGSAVGLPLCVNHPEKIEGIIFQNANAYMEGIGPQWDELRDFWEHPTEEKKKRVYAFISEEGVKGQYTWGLPDELCSRVSPESWMVDWAIMSKPGNADMQFELNCDYKIHIETFPVFQAYFRQHQPRAIVIWGKHDVFFSIEEAHSYKRDLPGVQVHIVNGGHWALETNFDEVRGLVNQFMSAK